MVVIWLRDVQIGKEKVYIQQLQFLTQEYEISTHSQPAYHFHYNLTVRYYDTQKYEMSW